MKTIYKYPLEIKGEQHIDVVDGAKLRHVGLDPQGQLCIWAEVKSERKEKYRHTVIIIGTGRPLPETMKSEYSYHNSVTMGDLVWHVYSTMGNWGN